MWFVAFLSSFSAAYNMGVSVEDGGWRDERGASRARSVFSGLRSVICRAGLSPVVVCIYYLSVLQPTRLCIVQAPESVGAKTHDNQPLHLPTSR